MDLNTTIGQQGFAIVQSVLTSVETDALLSSVGAATIGRGKAGIRHAMRMSSVRNLASDMRLLKLAEAALGPSAWPFKATIFDKSATANWLVMWHQDTALPLRERRELPGWGPWSTKDGICYAHAPASALAQVVALRIHFDDSGRDNGPLRVLPGTHQLGILNDSELHLLAEQTAPVDCLVPKGGVLIMRPLIVHASSKSVSNRPRRVLHIEYASCRQISGGLELAIA